MSQYSSSYGPYSNDSYGSQISPAKKALLLGAGALLAHRAGIGVKRALIMAKLRTGAVKSLPSSVKNQLLKDMKLKVPYERWAKKKLG